MKRIAAAFFFVLFLFAGISTDTAVAQSYGKTISADPVSLAWGLVNATYENRIGSSNSFTIFGSYWSITDWTAFGIGGSYRWYFDLNDGKKPLQGFSAGPCISIGFWDWAGDDFWGDYYDYSGGTSIAIGGEAAYKWVFSGGFTVEPVLRLTFNANKVSGLDYRAYGLGVNLGYSW